ncbi:MAG: ABC transporter permease [Proteobacteria bacterium]|nr:ABC transporter permease [Pseudomonadota bacterium]HQR02587.1 ABC transporter permease [Rhodocyclaceae bacterium]
MLPVLLGSDLLLFLLLGIIVAGAVLAWRDPSRRAVWHRIGRRSLAMASATVLALFLLVGLLDSVHYRLRLDQSAKGSPVYGVEVYSALDALLMPLKRDTEKTYSAPLATRLFTKESAADGGLRDFPRLRFGGAHLGENENLHMGDLGERTLRGLAGGILVWGIFFLLLGGGPGRTGVLSVLLVATLITGPAIALASGYHVFGTDKVGQDVLYLTLKSIRTGLLIGTLTTLVTVPLALGLGILAGYAGGRVDDAIQYLYTTLNSIPGVLLIAAAVLMMQVMIDSHPDWFTTTAERADARLLALCLILGMTSWTGLARLLRAETLKLRELEYVQAARAFGVSSVAVMGRHILPNLGHIVLISLVMDFSNLVLAEAVLSYVGIGVDPSTISFGTMINAARLELAREPMVWWSLVAAFSFMFVLVLAANLFADAIRDAFDPRAVN